VDDDKVTVIAFAVPFIAPMLSLFDHVHWFAFFIEIPVPKNLKDSSVLDPSV
jgi:hypothetical protein